MPLELSSYKSCQEVDLDMENPCWTYGKPMLDIWETHAGHMGNPCWTWKAAHAGWTWKAAHAGWIWKTAHAGWIWKAAHAGWIWKAAHASVKEQLWQD
jgi:hypothetical protein